MIRFPNLAVLRVLMEKPQLRRAGVALQRGDLHHHRRRPGGLLHAIHERYSHSQPMTRRTSGKLSAFYSALRARQGRKMAGDQDSHRDGGRFAYDIRGKEARESPLPAGQGRAETREDYFGRQPIAVADGVCGPSFRPSRRPRAAPRRGFCARSRFARRQPCGSSGPPQARHHHHH